MVCKCIQNQETHLIVHFEEKKNQCIDHKLCEILCSNEKSFPVYVSEQGKIHTSCNKKMFKIVFLCCVCLFVSFFTYLHPKICSHLRNNFT